MSELRNALLRLRTADPDLSYAELAAAAGCTYSAVYKALNPDAAKAYNRTTVKRRDDPYVRERKRATDRAYLARKRRVRP